MPLLEYVKYNTYLRIKVLPNHQEDPHYDQIQEKYKLWNIISWNPLMQQINVFFSTFLARKDGFLFLYIGSCVCARNG